MIADDTVSYPLPSQSIVDAGIMQPSNLVIDKKDLSWVFSTSSERCFMSLDASPDEELFSSILLYARHGHRRGKPRLSRECCTCVMNNAIT